MSKFARWMHVLWVGFRLRCPNCEQGKMFRGLLHMERVCPYCGVRYERQSGESVGGMYINLGVAELLSVGGYFLADALYDPPFVPHLIFWVTFNIVFCLVFYRHSRGMWVAITHLTGGLKRDEDYEREVIAQQPPPGQIRRNE
jgi:uncharacterized protein (DUF983 family)